MAAFLRAVGSLLLVYYFLLRPAKAQFQPLQDRVTPSTVIEMPNNDAAAAYLRYLQKASVLPTETETVAESKAKTNIAEMAVESAVFNPLFPDRREEEGWWNLYPFGERYFDIDIVDRPWKDLQIDLDFFFPFYGFRFNYTFIYPEGFVAFSFPEYVQPPYTFPNLLWPKRLDPSFVAAFLTAQSFVHVGDRRMSHVWYRTVARRYCDQRRRTNAAVGNKPHFVYSGHVVDDQLLDEITSTVHENAVGSRGFTADFVLIITWERLGYGGMPKYLTLQQYDEIKKWQNTYQMVLATDEHRSYAIFNYASINYTTSTSAGALRGRGGRQSAIVGFNGGNGTGFWQFPYSANGDSYKLAEFGSCLTRGRWMARVDEQIIYAGCSNDTHGELQLSSTWMNMIGGNSLNVSGPCFHPDDHIKLELDEEIVDCNYVNMVVARCFVPVYALFKIGLVTAQLAKDGRLYSWVTQAYVFSPTLVRTPVHLLNAERTTTPAKDWYQSSALNLTITWPAVNISTDPLSQVDIVLWGYWENYMDRDFTPIATVVRNLPNNGRFSFNPKQMNRYEDLSKQWARFLGGAIQVKVSGDNEADLGDYMYWSPMIPFGWYLNDAAVSTYGGDWSTKLCIAWYQNDGDLDEYLSGLYMKTPCPCTLDQAIIDFGRFTPLPNCDMCGDSSCPYNTGSQHCVLSTTALESGATQTCCYDFAGWLMFSQDFDYTDEYVKYFAAGIGYRSDPWGAYKYKRPPHVPSWSNFFNDLLPYDICCRWSKHCEFYYWRRVTSSCQDYRPARIGTVYGGGHVVTFDGTKYDFQASGDYVLVVFKSPQQNADLNVQIRVETVPQTKMHIVTGVAMQASGSSVVQILARKEHRRWRYKTDLFVDSVQHFLDTDKRLHFKRVTIYVPQRVMNQSLVYVQFHSGVGVMVSESRGVLQKADPPNGEEATFCHNSFVSLGLLGTYNDNQDDDLTTPNCSVEKIQLEIEQTRNSLVNKFAEKWLLENANYDSLFLPDVPPIFGDCCDEFTDVFRASWLRANESVSFYLQLQPYDYPEIEALCHSVSSCISDYFSNGKLQIALDTLSAEVTFDQQKRRGENKLVSCGPLEKGVGVIKYPSGNNYLHGAKVVFSCETNYFLHGTAERYCNGGVWSPGWPVWCRDRQLETGLKWMTGILSSAGIVIVVGLIFLLVYRSGFKKRGMKVTSLQIPVRTVATSRSSISSADRFDQLMNGYPAAGSRQSKVSNSHLLGSRFNEIAPRESLC